jgi:hypothetical protein
VFDNLDSSNSTHTHGRLFSSIFLLLFPQSMDNVFLRRVLSSQTSKQERKMLKMRVKEKTSSNTELFYNFCALRRILFRYFFNKTTPV